MPQEKNLEKNNLKEHHEINNSNSFGIFAAQYKEELVPIPDTEKNGCIGKTIPRLH